MSVLNKSIALMLGAMFSAKAALALTFALPPAGDSLVGAVQTLTVTKPQTLADIGRAYNIGYIEMVSANADLPKNTKIAAGEQVRIPAQFILPKTRTGLVINLAELRVYYFPLNQSSVYTFPLAAGRSGWNTPVGVTTIISKVANPTWTVPPSIMKESIQKGKKLKPFFGADDPANPLGHYALYLGLPGIRMHGTLAPGSIGRRASHGCMRLWDNDIEFLYHNVPVGTRVFVDHLEASAGWQQHILYLKVESPFKEYHDPDAAAREIKAATLTHSATIDWQKVAEVVDNQEGIPTAIGFDATQTGLPPESVEQDTVEAEPSAEQSLPAVLE